MYEPRFSASAQVAAINVARRIVGGSSKPPKVGGSEAKLLLQQLEDAAATLNAIRSRGDR